VSGDESEHPDAYAQQQCMQLKDFYTEEMNLLARRRLKAWGRDTVFYLQELFVQGSCGAEQVSCGSSPAAHASKDHALVPGPRALFIAEFRRVPACTQLHVPERVRGRASARMSI